MGPWTQQTAFTSPGRHAASLRAFGEDPASIVATIQSLLIHGEALEHYGVTPGPFSRETISVETRLDELLAVDPRPLTAPRLPRARAVGTCRDYAVLACSTFRQRGQPARVRCGFAAYFGGAPWEDHWVCELWSGGRWRRVDAQLDSVLQRVLAIQIPAEDVPTALFLTGHQAWKACRGGELNADTLAHGSEAAGLWFVLVNLVRDRLALADRLTSPWDEWRQAASNPPALGATILAAADALAKDGKLPAILENPWWTAS